MGERFFKHPCETWDEKKCHRLSRRIAKDGLGTKYSFRGYIGGFGSYGTREYNGGCTREGEWYDGEIFPLPELPDGYEIVVVPTWGYRIQKKGG